MRNEQELVSLVPGSIDQVRVIRRSRRCFIYGAIGLVPVLGTGLAVQALRLRDDVAAEVGERWAPPPILWLWLGGWVVLWGADAQFGFSGALVAGMALLGAQSWMVWRQAGSDPEAVWNPGRPMLVLGTLFAYAGLSASGWAVALLISRAVRTSAPL